MSVDVLDSEVLEMERVIEILKDRAENWPGGVDRGHFDNEIATRFAEIGFAVNILWYDTDHLGVIMPEITVVGRTRRVGEFDHDQMAHEVQSDILGLGQGGKIKLTAEDVRKMNEIDAAHKGHGEH